MAFVVLLILLVAGILGYRHWATRQRVKGLLASELSDEERRILMYSVPLVRRLPDDLRRKLEGKMALFRDQVTFYGNDGLEITEEMEISIAAQACLLIVNTDVWYGNLRTILVYPSAFKSKQQRQSGFVVTEKEIVRTGESWNRGPVILSWAHSKIGALNDRDGHNVVLHEFAHQIDDLSGRTNGVPLLGEGQSFAEWETVFLNAFEQHSRAIERGQRTLIDAYGAEGHEEFFAVSVEVFFEKPQELLQDSPEIYMQLSKLFRLDPVRWQ